MQRSDERYQTPKWRTFWLMLAFAVLVGIGIVTVLRPELEDEPSKDAAAAMETSAGPAPDKPLQE